MKIDLAALLGLAVAVSMSGDPKPGSCPWAFMGPSIRPGETRTARFRLDPALTGRGRNPVPGTA